MKIAYNPTTAAALTAAPSNNDITFDLKGIAIYAKGVKFKGTDTTYSVFKKHTSDNKGGYNGLVPVPSYTTTTTRYLREDGTWVVPTNTTYAVVSSTANGLAPKVINTNTTTVGSAYYVLASTDGLTTPSWYKLPANAFKNDNTTYTFVSGNGGFTVTPSGGTAQIVSIGKIDWTNITNKPDTFTPTSHIHTTLDITTLTGYTKAETVSDLATSDSLNTALGKLEYKADLAYDWYLSITGEDTDDVINKWEEIVDFIDSVKEGTDITDEFVTRKTDQTITGAKTFSKVINITNSAGSWVSGMTNAAIQYDSLNALNSESYHPIIGVKTNGENVVNFGAYVNDIGFYGYKKGRTENNYDWLFKFNSETGAIIHTGTSITAIKFIGTLNSTLTFSAGTFSAKTYDNSAAVTVNIPTHTSHLTNNSGFLTLHQSLANYVTLDTKLIITGQKTFNSSIKMEADTGLCMSIKSADNGSDPWITIINYPNYGIRYFNSNVDKLTISASGNANDASKSDLCINGNGDGTVTIRGKNILHAGNYNSYSPKLDGTGATGTWGINISGNSAESSKLNMTPITSYDGLTPIGVYGYNNTNGDTENNGYPCSNSSAAIAWGKDNCKVILAARAGQTNSEVYIRLYYKDWGDWFKLLHSGNTHIDSGTITINGVSITPLTAHQSLTNYVTLNTALTITGLKTFESDSSTTGVSLILKNKGWKASMSTAMDFYNGGSYKVPNARIETKMGDSGKTGGTLIFYTQTKHASTNPNPNGLTERLRIDDNGTTKITGVLTTTGNITSAGFVKSGSSDSYVLLGGGGHKAISDFLLKSEVANQELSNNLTTITKTLEVSKDWIDTDIVFNDATFPDGTGSYIVQLSLDNSYYWTGCLSVIISTNTTKADSDEIILHGGGFDYSGQYYLRTIHDTTNKVVKLLIARSETYSIEKTYTFKFKKLI